MPLLDTFRVSRLMGIPLTKSVRQRKLGALIGKLFKSK